jgi:rhodanese-related sulfurtransferase
MKLNCRIIVTVSLLGIFAIPRMTIQAQQPTATPEASSATTIPASAILQPTDLVQLLRSSAKPIVFQIGSHVLYAEAHIPGSEYIGAAGTSAGLQPLRVRAANLKKDELIVIYCGCCPWGRCPNIRPAYEQLQALGFTNVKALYLADNFGTDWVDKGYPVAKGR